MTEYVVTAEFKNGDENEAFQVLAADEDAATNLVWEHCSGQGRPLDASSVETLADVEDTWGPQDLVKLGHPQVREAVLALRAAALTARDSAHVAYETALRGKPGTSKGAYTALLDANRVLRQVDALLLSLTV